MRSELYYENRIAKLKAKDEVQNRALIAKAMRRLRKLKESKQDTIDFPNFKEVIQSFSDLSNQFNNGTLVFKDFVDTLYSYSY